MILAATAADADWSDLPTRPMFLPLIQRLVTYAATHATPPRNVPAGQPMLARLSTPGPDGKPPAFAGEDDAPSVGLLLEIERGHLALVMAQIDELTGTGYWFDTQEFNLEG